MGRGPYDSLSGGSTGWPPPAPQTADRQVACPVASSAWGPKNKAEITRREKALSTEELHEGPSSKWSGGRPGEQPGGLRVHVEEEGIGG